jgi:signal transduction histidine kinase
MASRGHQQSDEMMALRYDFVRAIEMLGHEMATPLQVVCGELELLPVRLRGKADAATQDRLRRARDQALRIDRAVKALSHYTELEKQRLDMGLVELTVVMRAALGRLEPQLRSRGAVVDWQDLPQAWACAPRVQEVLERLIDNAVRFKREGQPVVAVSAEQRDGMVVVHVRDNGPGFGQRVPDKLFQPFYRAHSVEWLDTDGVGLAICKAIVVRHGGEIGLQLRPEGGSDFWFSLPAAEAPAGGG